MKRLVLVFIFIVAASAVVPAARAWEAQTTNAGLTEAAALGSSLHARLERDHGLQLGVYAPLTVPREGGGALYERLKLLDPTEGYVPDARGRQSALAWLVAGAVLEEVPGSRSRHHFYDPAHKTGLTGEGLGGLSNLVERRLWARAGGGEARGMAAPDWILSPENDLGLGRFHKELAAAVSGKTHAEREQHLAFALLCAGAMSAVLEDVGSPSRARDDLSEHLLPLGGGSGDRGSRFEYLAALAYGRVGIAVPEKPVARPRLRDFFTAGDGQGLADRTSARWYSSGTLPRRLQVRTRPAAGALVKRVTAAQPFAAPAPAPGSELDLDAAASDGAATLRNARGVCLARYRFADAWLEWFIDDDCAAEQMAVILPEVAAYAAGFLDYLFRGELEVTTTGVVRAGATALGPGTLTIYAEAEDGTRTPLGEPIAIDVAAAGQELGGAALPGGTVHVVALFVGKDTAGDDIVAVGRSPAP
jgi:hypothetical protein